MKVFILTSTTNVYSDDVHLDTFIDTGDGEGEKRARSALQDRISRGPRDGDETGIDLWVLDMATGKTEHLGYTKVTDFDEDEENEENEE